ncbi:MAG: hypothetical protein IT353_11880 [Gemmatimonadaceae bacterium]|nr:hypothetical protein [Gemmatimonadaceae bacterium]
MSHQRARLTSLTLLAAACLATTTAPAIHAQPGTTLRVVLKGSNSSNGYLKIEGVDGESIMSPRDPQSGLATGKRTHKPIMAKAPAGTIEEFQVIVANPPSARTSSVLVTLSAEGGGTCKASIPTTYDAAAKRVDVAIGDAARFFDAAKRPRPDLCPTR